MGIGFIAVGIILVICGFGELSNKSGLNDALVTIFVSLVVVALGILLLKAKPYLPDKAAGNEGLSKSNDQKKLE